MHELSIALGLLDIVADAAPAGRSVTALHIRLGDLRGVSASALTFAFQVAAVGTAADRARIEIERVPVRLWCQPCSSTVVATPRLMSCPRCATPGATVVSGRELELAWIEIDDPAACPEPEPAPASGGT